MELFPTCCDSLFVTAELRPSLASIAYLLINICTLPSRTTLPVSKHVVLSSSLTDLTTAPCSFCSSHVYIMLMNLFLTAGVVVVTNSFHAYTASPFHLPYLFYISRALLSCSTKTLSSRSKRFPFYYFLA